MQETFQVPYYLRRDVNVRFSPYTAEWRVQGKSALGHGDTLYCREWTQFLILLVAEFGCFLLVTAGTVIVEAVEWFSGWISEIVNA